MNPIPFASIISLPDKAAIQCVSGTILYVNEVQNTQWGDKQSLKLRDAAGQEMYIRFTKCPPFGQERKGQVITLQADVGVRGMQGLTKSVWMKSGAANHQIEATSAAKLFFGAPSTGGYDAPAPAPAYREPGKATAPHTPPHVPAEAVEASLDRWLAVYDQVCERNKARGEAMVPQVPESALPALTTHILLNFR